RFSRLINHKRRQAHAAQGRLWKDVAAPVWQKRFYDFNVWTERKRVEKLRYMHRNPVKRGLVKNPEQRRWSSFRSYLYGEKGLVRVNYQESPSRIARRLLCVLCGRYHFGFRVFSIIAHPVMNE